MHQMHNGRQPNRNRERKEYRNDWHEDRRKSKPGIERHQRGQESAKCDEEILHAMPYSIEAISRLNWILSLVFQKGFTIEKLHIPIGYLYWY